MRYALAIATLLAALLLASLAQASAQEFPLDESDTGKCICMRSSCNAACARKPNPEVLAALRKQFPQMTDNEDVIVFDDDHQCYNRRCYTVAFSTPLRNMACTLTLNPVKLRNCRTRHA